MKEILDAIPQAEICLSAARAQYETYIDTQEKAFLSAARDNLTKAKRLGASPLELERIRAQYERN